MNAGPISGAVPRSRAVLWVAQWLGVILVPAWLVYGTGLIAGPGSGSYFVVAFVAALLLVLLLIAAILSVGIRSARRGRGGPWYVWLLAAVWACAAVQPFLLESDSPSALERLGLSMAADRWLISFLFWAAVVLLALAWISTGAAGAPPPFGDGSDRELRQGELRQRDRIDELNHTRSDSDSG